MKFFDKSKAGKLALGLSVALAFVGFSFAGVASAQNLDANSILSALLNDPALLAQLQGLLAGNTGSTGGSMMTTGCNFTRDLTMGSTGDDVKCLQQWLNSHGYTVATTGAGSMGNESTYFGPATQAALSRFQTTAGVSPAAGYFGPLTGAALASVTGPVAPGIPGGTPTPGLPTGCTSSSGFSAVTG